MSLFLITALLFFPKALLSHINLSKLRCRTPFFKESMVSEAGKQTLLLIAAPIIISASVGVSTFAKWAFERLTKKLDEKLDGKQAKA